MRNNEPVTQNEIDYRDSVIIFSRSDPKGVATEVNADFTAISGYAPADVIGKPHNILRHPDMPREAFDDLWRTIQSGLLWNGIVKNRATSGDHYWVEANVAPVIDNAGHITGYVSVRTKPTREQINAAQDLYTRVNRGQAHLPRAPLRARQIVTCLIVALAVIPGLLAATGVPWPWITGTAALLGALLFWQTIRLVFAPIDRLRRTMLDCQADGNLARRAAIGRDDEIGQLAKTYNALMLTMRSITREVRNVATDVAREISDVAALGAKVQANTAAQQQDTMQAAASIEELTVTSSTIADSATEVRAAAEACKVLNSTSHQRVDDLRRDFGKVADQVEAIETAAKQFDVSTAEIQAMVAHVREIADQTNLLALNAAIEAARAGDHGRGFAVVADEVRKLAGTSAETASRIQRVTGEIVAGAGAVRTLVDVTLSNVSSGQETMTELTTVLSDSEARFEITHAGVTGISLATGEQASASTSLAQNVESVSQRGEDNEHAMRALAELAGQSNQRARALLDLVSRFN